MRQRLRLNLQNYRFLLLILRLLNYGLLSFVFDFPGFFNGLRHRLNFFLRLFYLHYWRLNLLRQWLWYWLYFLFSFTYKRRRLESLGNWLRSWLYIFFTWWRFLTDPTRSLSFLHWCRRWLYWLARLRTDLLSKGIHKFLRSGLCLLRLNCILLLLFEERALELLRRLRRLLYLTWCILNNRFRCFDLFYFLRWICYWGLNRLRRNWCFYGLRFLLLGSDRLLIKEWAIELFRSWCTGQFNCYKRIFRRVVRRIFFHPVVCINFLWRLNRLRSCNWSCSLDLGFWLQWADKRLWFKCTIVSWCIKFLLEHRF